MVAQWARGRGCEPRARQRNLPRGAVDTLERACDHATRELLGRIVGEVNDQMVFVSATKGVENETGMRVSEIVADVLGRKIRAPRFVCLSGPSFAREVAEGQPTAVVAASERDELARLIQSELSVQNFRVYTNGDLVGTELGGAVKNVMALAAGMVAGLGLYTFYYQSTQAYAPRPSVTLPR